MNSLNDQEITTIKGVEKLVKIAGSELSDALKKHVKTNHMLPVKQGKSYFLSPEEASVWRLIEEACNCPDSVTPHRSDVNRYVLKKRFNAPVGTHGETGLPCVCLIVILGIKDQTVVTAFPSM